MLVLYSRLIVIKINTYSWLFHTKSIRIQFRIGPHNLEVISVLVGCLLGDAPAYLSKTMVPGTSFRIKQSGCHKNYFFFLYDFFFTKGYCTNEGPREYKTILINTLNVKKKIHYGYEFDFLHLVIWIDFIICFMLIV